MIQFATYLHPHTCYTSRPVSPDVFVGYSYPHYSQIREGLATALNDYTELPVKNVEYDQYRRVHSQDYLDKLTLMAADQPIDAPPKLSAECRGYEYCLPGYQYGLGGMFQAIDALKTGNLDRAFCFCLGGHHAYADWGHGYCLLNPLAVTAKYAQANGFEKVLIVDWDIHHGDGTQSIFANDESVYCISIHSVADLYMSKAAGMRIGSSEAGKTVGHCNIPLLHRIFKDDFFEEVGLNGTFYRAEQSLAAFQQALTQVPFQPDIILIFAGCDSHQDDGGADITDWDNEDFKALTRLTLDLSKQASCPVLSCQGGGYNLPVTLAATVAHVEVLARDQ
ncbi:MAG: histone deacetylase [Chloroflexota bacterium]